MSSQWQCFRSHGHQGRPSVVRDKPLLLKEILPESVITPHCNKDKVISEKGRHHQRDEGKLMMINETILNRNRQGLS